MSFTEKQKEYLAILKGLPNEFRTADVSDKAGAGFNNSTWHTSRIAFEEAGAIEAVGRGLWKKTTHFEDVSSGLKIKKRGKPKKTDTYEQVAPLDISPTADSLANSVSALIAENEKLRNTLRQINALTGKLLNIQE